MNEKPYWDWKRVLITLLWFPLALFYLEVVLKIYCFRSLLDKGLGYTALFTVSGGLLCALSAMIWGRRGNRAVSVVITALATVWCMIQTVYYTIFTTFLTLYSMGGAGDVLQFWRDILDGIRAAWLPLLLELVPLLLLCVLGCRFLLEDGIGARLFALLAASSVSCYMITLLFVFHATGGVMSPRYIYAESFVPELTVKNFGVFTTLRLDLKQLLFGTASAGSDSPVPEENGTDTDHTETDTTETDTEDTEETDTGSAVTSYGDHVLEIDFDALMAEETDQTLLDMYQYFSSREPTAQNEYTGLFEGKNLIWITAEGFCWYAVNEELTPTLYRLANSGFVFENFYNPLWWVSTSDGEYVACTSLIPKSGVWSMYRSGDNDMYFCLGNQLGRLGYTTLAYHDHTYNYYHRDISHPNMGYLYKGLGNGLDVTPTWPESDLEMMELTIPEYIGEEPFHIYYMTVSGHMNYSFMGNSMSAKHQDEVADLDMSESARAYLACQMELDAALEYLLDQLEEAGILEDTVICLSGDHYPYGLDKSAIDELAGYEVEENFELYRSTLILWSGDMADGAVVVEKPCSSLDILPTLSNLFGVEYDSRLLMGRDILSDSPALVVLSNRSFITDYGRYNSQTDTFTPNEGAEVSGNYAAGILEEVVDMFSYSTKVLDTDFYRMLGLGDE